MNDTGIGTREVVEFVWYFLVNAFGAYPVFAEDSEVHIVCWTGDMRETRWYEKLNQALEVMQTAYVSGRATLPLFAGVRRCTERRTFEIEDVA